MIKKLKKRFTIVTTLTISLVLLLLLGTTNIITRNSIMQKIDSDISAVAMNTASIKDGVFQNPTDANSTSQEGKEQDDTIRDEIKQNSGLIFPFISIPPGEDRGKNLLRSFYAIVDDDRNIVSINTDFYPIITDSEAEELLNEALKSSISGNTDDGFLDNYKYYYDENNSTFILMDCSTELSSIKNFLEISIFVFLGGVALVLILTFIFMGTAIKPIAESYEKQKRFITDASHELKTPLTIIDTNTELTEMETGETKWTKNSHKQVERLRKLTNDLVTLTRMDEENNDLVTEEVSVSDIANDVVMGYDSICLSKGKKLNANIEDDVNIIGIADSIEKLFTILLDNAIKYSDDNGSITIELRKTGKKKILTISNTVKYIAKGTHNQYFERFYRSDESRNSELGGHGIGLSIAKAIVKTHKGKISAVSEDEKTLKVEVIFS